MGYVKRLIGKVLCGLGCHKYTGKYRDSNGVYWSVCDRCGEDSNKND